MQLARFVPTRLWSAVFATIISLSSPFSGSALAQSEIIDSAFSTCNTVNCSATSIAGWVGSSAAQVLPWTGKFLIVAGNCLRLQVRFIRVASANLEMVVVAPNGLTRYRNDQGGTACVNCPVVKVSPAPVTGYYTVIISSNNGAPIDTDFHLLFGQYPRGNANCASPTPRIP
jgi:hypothetical protein